MAYKLNKQHTQTSIKCILMTSCVTNERSFSFLSTINKSSSESKSGCKQNKFFWSELWRHLTGSGQGATLGRHRILSRRQIKSYFWESESCLRIAALSRKADPKILKASTASELAASTDQNLRRRRSIFLPEPIPFRYLNGHRYPVTVHCSVLRRRL